MVDPRSEDFSCSSQKLMCLSTVRQLAPLSYFYCLGSSFLVMRERNLSEKTLLPRMTRFQQIRFWLYHYQACPTKVRGSSYFSAVVFAYLILVLVKMSRHTCESRDMSYSIGLLPGFMTKLRLFILAVDTPIHPHPRWNIRRQ